MEKSGLRWLSYWLPCELMLSVTCKTLRPFFPIFPPENSLSVLPPCIIAGFKEFRNGGFVTLRSSRISSSSSQPTSPPSSHPAVAEVMDPESPDSCNFVWVSILFFGQMAMAKYVCGKMLVRRIWQGQGIDSGRFLVFVCLTIIQNLLFLLLLYCIFC